MVADGSNARGPIGTFVTRSVLILVVTPFPKARTTVLVAERTQYSRSDLCDALREAPVVVSSTRPDYRLFTSVNARGSLSTFESTFALTTGQKLTLRSKPLLYRRWAAPDLDGA